MQRYNKCNSENVLSTKNICNKEEQLWIYLEKNDFNNSFFFSVRGKNIMVKVVFCWYCCFSWFSGQQS